MTRTTRRACDGMIVRPVKRARYGSSHGWGMGEEKMVEAIANKQSERKQTLMVGTYMKQMKMKVHKKLLQRYDTPKK